MVGKYRYVPLLRTKTGEADAIANVSGSARARILPLLHLVVSPPTTFAPKFGQAWSQLPAALDGVYNLGMTASSGDFTKTFQALGKSGVKVIPSVPYSAPPAYTTAAKHLINQYAPGLVVKVRLAEMAGLNAWTAAHGWKPQDIDLVIDAEDVSGYDPDIFALVVRETIKKHMQPPTPWRTVTLASASAPQNLGGLQAGRIDIARRDWLLWKALHPQVSFKLDYGDYGIATPDLTEPPGVAMTRATVSVRYTAADHWIVIKGKPQAGAKGQPMGVQYRAHAKVLVADPKFNGLVATCWGDQRIKQIASSSSGPGNRTTWVAIGANRHLSLVADRLP